MQHPLGIGPMDHLKPQDIQRRLAEQGYPGATDSQTPKALAEFIVSDQQPSWATATPQQIIADIKAATEAMRSRTGPTDQERLVVALGQIGMPANVSEDGRAVEMRRRDFDRLSSISTPRTLGPPDIFGIEIRLSEEQP